MPRQEPTDLCGRFLQGWCAASAFNGTLAAFTGGVVPCPRSGGPSLLGWMAAAGAAVMLAFNAPHDRQVLGKLPSAAAERVAQTYRLLPPELPPGRLLAVVTFEGSPREEIQGW